MNNTTFAVTSPHGSSLGISLGTSSGTSLGIALPSPEIAAGTGAFAVGDTRRATDRVMTLTDALTRPRGPEPV